MAYDDAVGDPTTSATDDGTAVGVTVTATTAAAAATAFAFAFAVDSVESAGVLRNSSTRLCSLRARTMPVSCGSSDLRRMNGLSGLRVRCFCGNTEAGFVGILGGLWDSR